MSSPHRTGVWRSSLLLTPISSFWGPTLTTRDPVTPGLPLEHAQGGDPAPLPHLGLVLGVSSGLSVEIDAGAVTIAGQSLAVGIGVALSNGAVTVAGQSLTTAIGVALNAGAITVAGQSLTFATDVAVTAGAVSVAGQSATFTLSVPLGAGAVTIAGETLALDLPSGGGDPAPLPHLGLILAPVTDLAVEIDAGSITVTGQSLTVSFGVNLAQGAVTVAGQSLTTALTVALSAGAVTIAGQTVETALPIGGGDPAPLPSIGLLLQDTGSLGVTIDAGALTIAGQAIGFTWSVPWDEGGITVTGQDVTVSLSGETAQSSGGWWPWRLERELVRRLKKRIRQVEDEEAVEAALEAVGEPIPDTRGDDLARLKALVNAFGRAYEPSKKTQKAVEYARRSQTRLAYELAIREAAKQVEEEEDIAILMAIAAIV